MAFLAIVACSTVLAVLYGIVHDQITIRVCLEYFTVGHPRVFETQDSTLLALAWGVYATWWGGLVAGIVIAGAARWGSLPKAAPREVVPSLLVLLLVMACVAAAAGIGGYLAARAGWVRAIGTHVSEIPVERHDRFLAAFWAHVAAYAIGGVGAVVIAVRTARSRRARS